MSKRKSRKDRKVVFTYKNGKKVLVEKDKKAPKGGKPSPAGASNESQKKS